MTSPGERGTAVKGGVATLTRSTHPKRTTRLTGRTRRRVTGLSMVAPLLVIVLAFIGWPIIWTLILSFTNMTITGPTATHFQFIGFGNFRQLFSAGSGLVQSILLSLYYLVASAYIGQALFGFVLAYMMLRCAVSVRKVVGSIIIVCWLVPEIIAAWMWFAMLSDGGTLQQGLHAIGFPYQTWLISHPMLSVSLANSWRGVAFSFLLFSAALRTFRSICLMRPRSTGRTLGADCEASSCRFCRRRSSWTSCSSRSVR